MQVHRCQVNEDAGAMAGLRLDHRHFDFVFGGDVACDVIKPDGTFLLRYRPGWFSDALCNQVGEVCRSAAVETDQRGLAAGDLTYARIDKKDSSPEQNKKKVSIKALKKDGTISNTFSSGVVKSGVVGFFDRTARYPFCRQTAFLIKNAAKWMRFQDFIIRADDGFRELMPERWQKQSEAAEKTHSDWVIPQSTFTTVTVNKNFQTAVHKDAGDLKEGFGVMACLRNEKYSGAYLVFPAFRVAVDFGHGSLCVADVHEWHGNSGFEAMKAGYERITCVFYYREKMLSCLSAEAEIDRVKNRTKGDPLR
jgi:hypothetical protein